MKVLFLSLLVVASLLLLVDPSFCDEDDKKKEDFESNAPATLATPSALFKCGEVREKNLFEKKHDNIKILLINGRE
jgi:hypothetical protein